MGVALMDIYEALDAELSREFPATEKDTTMAVLNNDPNRYPSATPKTERASPFDDLVNAVSSMRELQGRASGLADKIAGSAPHDISESKDKRGASGLVDVVEIAVENIREICAHITDDLQRIERRL